MITLTRRFSVKFVVSSNPNRISIFANSHLLLLARERDSRRIPTIGVENTRLRILQITEGGISPCWAPSALGLSYELTFVISPSNSNIIRWPPVHPQENAQPFSSFRGTCLRILKTERRIICSQIADLPLFFALALYIFRNTF